jgi:hypothetical protein
LLTRPAVETNVPVASDPRLPEGEHRTAALTRDQTIAAGVAAGFDQADVEEFIDGGDAIVEAAAFRQRLEDGTWMQLSNLNGAPSASAGPLRGRQRRHGGRHRALRALQDSSHDRVLESLVSTLATYQDQA